MKLLPLILLTALLSGCVLQSDNYGHQIVNPVTGDNVNDINQGKEWNQAPIDWNNVKIQEPK